MMTKEQERQELHNTIWSIANDLRGSVDGWDFKSYIFGFLFYRYISEDICFYINKGEWEAGNKEFDYSLCSDDYVKDIKQDIVKEKGYFIFPSQLFENVRRNAKDNNPQEKTEDNLNEILFSVFQSIEASAMGTNSENDFKGLFDDIDVNSKKLGNTVNERNKKLTKIMNKISELNLGSLQDNQIDSFGDAYEYLMRMYAANGGKSGGEYFTPQEVSELLAMLVIHGKTEVNKVYDPACGSGSLLLKFAKLLGKDRVRSGFFGQEINITTYNLCRINMILHNVGFDKFDIALGDTLLNPQHWDNEPFDCIVSNPPYSIKWEGDDNPTLINDIRFSPAGVLAPKSKADLAFTMHMLSWLSNKGTAAIVEFPGVLYRTGAEEKIRQYLISNNYVDCVIQLPANLFFGVSIATCIIILKKNKEDNGILFLDASNLFVHEGNKNKLSNENIREIYSLYAERKDKEHLCCLVSNSQVLENGSNLSVSSYVEQEDGREKVDIDKLNTEISEVVGRITELRRDIDLLIKEIV